MLDCTRNSRLGGLAEMIGDYFTDKGVTLKLEEKELIEVHYHSIQSCIPKIF